MESGIVQVKVLLNRCCYAPYVSGTSNIYCLQFSQLYHWHGLFYADIENTQKRILQDEQKYLLYKLDVYNVLGVQLIVYHMTSHKHCHFKSKGWV
jgi:hypothetical protein